LAIIWLYERVKNGEFEYGIFKEKDIHRAFEAVSSIGHEPPSRSQWVTYNEYIMKLQEFYLIYNDENQTYKFVLSRPLKRISETLTIRSILLKYTF